MYKLATSLALLGIMFFSCQQGETSKEQPTTLLSDYYTEHHRPQAHFSPEKMWMNDPNGMVYYEGEYHLFYQHYPDGDVWGPMHWGHAISTDMLHWEHLPIALYPDSLGYIFSGSAVVDENNTAGFQTGEEKALVAIYTYHDTAGEKAGTNDFQTQGIAYSNDKGRTWTKYEGNPVIPSPGIKDFRDPKVFWHEESSQWVMILAVKDRVHLYQSANLKEWTFASEFGADQGSHGGVWECPDLFELPIEGTDETRWLMIVSLGSGGPNGGSGTMYFVGDFDGSLFTNANTADEVLWLDYGKDNYAGVTWSDVPEADGRRIFLGWMSNWQYATKVPTRPWRSAMTLPRVLSFVQTEGGLRLKQAVVAEMEGLRGLKSDLGAREVAGELDQTGEIEFDPDLSEMKVHFRWEAETAPQTLGIMLSNALGEQVKLGLDLAGGQYFVDRRQAGKMDFSEAFPGLHLAPAKQLSNEMTLEVFWDHASVELLAEEGLTVMTDNFFPNERFTKLAFFTEGGKAEMTQAELYQLEGVWAKP
ncbi:MAG: glycoside hydrolase family 32 protein [Bacteroidota bacterium]